MTVGPKTVLRALLGECHDRGRDEPRPWLFRCSVAVMTSFLGGADVEAWSPVAWQAVRRGILTAARVQLPTGAPILTVLSDPGDRANAEDRIAVELTPPPGMGAESIIRALGVRPSPRMKGAA